MFLSAQVKTTLTWALKIGRFTMWSASIRNRGKSTLVKSDLASRIGRLIRSFSALISMILSAPASSAAFRIPLTSRDSIVSQPMADASARIICLGLALRSTLITAETTAGLVFTLVSGGNG